MATADISQHLAAPEWNVAKIIEDQLTTLDAELTALGTLRQRLAEVVSDDACQEPELLVRAHQAIATPYRARKAVAMLPYTDVLAACDWLGDVFQLPPGPLTPATGSTYASVVTSQGLIHLHQATEGLQPPSNSGVCSAMLIVTVDDVDHLAAHISSKQGRITHGPAGMPYGVREVGAADLAGHI